jgi:hypothetical protein
MSSGGYHHHVSANTWRSPGARLREPHSAGLSWFAFETADERAEAKAALGPVTQRRNQLIVERDARLAFLLANDAEYQRLKDEHQAAKKEADELLGKLHSYRFTAGKSVGGLFFQVLAEGDSWEDVIAKLKARSATRSAK